ncbi:2-hydroxyacid dehydrogenase [Bartonella choladocola]|uniref:Glyoxylate/hydroxypyruvate reductase A n=1 Tax=Bartonella choladocola TaxID=2750995 RepID=A0A1U9MKS2_9HYPH|nr:glyoxylate/hydroxypyruvate reductase A [Bartonella choladocola]AQT48494.1 glyoxylate/hydroxypyruvate reductase A [Bartonella choladocola]
MAEPIAFVSRSAQTERDNWLKVLSENLGDEKIIDFNDLKPDDYGAIELAIVANPDPDQLKKLKNLKWIQSLWAGVERMVKELPENAPPIVRLIDPALTEAMAEAVLAWTLYLTRDMPRYHRQQQKRLWQPHSYKPASQWKIGLLGLGQLGKAAAKLLTLTGFQVNGWSKSQKTLDNVTCSSGSTGFMRLIETSDIVVLLIPLTNETTGLLGKNEFAHMKKGASLINFSRGPVIDTDALVDALNKHELDHAVLDVFDQEPLPPDSPLWQNENITVLPHISAPTNKESAAKIVAKNIAHWRKTGNLPPVVNRMRGY